MSHPAAPPPFTLPLFCVFMLFPLRKTNFFLFWKLFVCPLFQFSLVFPHFWHFCRLTFQNVFCQHLATLGQTWSWPNLVWPNLVTKFGQTWSLAKLGLALLHYPRMDTEQIGSKVFEQRSVVAASSDATSSGNRTFLTPAACSATPAGSPSSSSHPETASPGPTCSAENRPKCVWYPLLPSGEGAGIPNCQVSCVSQSVTCVEIGKEYGS